MKNVLIFYFLVFSIKISRTKSKCMLFFIILAPFLLQLSKFREEDLTKVQGAGLAKIKDYK